MEPEKEDFAGEHRLVRNMLLTVAIVLPCLAMWLLCGPYFAALLLVEVVVYHAAALGVGILTLVVLYALISHIRANRNGPVPPASTKRFPAGGAGPR